jgi:hypothetical protein
MEASNTTQAVTLLIYIREVSGLNHGWDTDYLKVCSDLHKSFQANVRIVTQLDDLSGIISNSVIIVLPFGAACKASDAGRNKQTNTYVAWLHKMLGSS